MATSDVAVGADVKDVSRPRVRPLNWGVCVGVLFLGQMLLWADRTNFSVAASVWAKQYHWSPSTMGALLSAFSFGYLIMMPIGGWIGDRAGPRRTVAATCMAWSLAQLFTPIAPAVLWVTATFRALLGISEAPYVSAISISIAKAVPRAARRGRFTAFIQSGSQLGPAAGVFFAGVILKATNAPAMIFIAFGLFGIALAIGWWLYAMRHSDPAPPATEAESAEALARSNQTRVPVRKFITSRRLWPIYIGYFALPYSQYLFLTWLPHYLTAYRHIPIIEASYLSSLPFLAAFIGGNATGWAMDLLASLGWRRADLHRKLFIYIGAALYASTTMIAATTSSATTAVTMIVVANLGLSIYVYPYWTMVADIAPQQAGTFGGVMNFCGIVGATISPVLSGIIAEATHEFVAPLQVAAGLMVAAAIVAALFIKIRPLNELVDA